MTINISMLYGQHLQICFSKLTVSIFSVRYPTWLNCHNKVSILTTAMESLSGGGDSVSVLQQKKKQNLEINRNSELQIIN